MSTNRFVLFLFGISAFCLATVLWFPDYESYDALYCRNEDAVTFCVTKQGKRREDESCPPTIKINGRTALLWECDGERIQGLRN